MLIWTTDLEDKFLDLVLPCEADYLYQRALVEFAKHLDRNSKVGLREGDQFLRRRSNRRTDYRGPLHEMNRCWRAGLPFTWTETRILDWADNIENAEGRCEVTVEYIANLLQRPVREIDLEKQRRERQPDGIPAFEGL